MGVSGIAGGRSVASAGRQTVRASRTLFVICAVLYRGVVGFARVKRVCFSRQMLDNDGLQVYFNAAMHKLALSIGLLFMSNVVMTFAWYGFLRKPGETTATPMWQLILMSWRSCWSPKLGADELGAGFV